ncbi:unnamed protein product [Closterium sp. Naga37s-1]|nr:unnamed protein product [Closterium sp. Naga37s-1]
MARADPFPLTQLASPLISHLAVPLPPTAHVMTSATTLSPSISRRLSARVTCSASPFPISPSPDSFDPLRGSNLGDGAGERGTRGRQGQSRQQRQQQRQQERQQLRQQRKQAEWQERSEKVRERTVPLSRRPDYSDELRALQLEEPDPPGASRADPPRASRADPPGASRADPAGARTPPASEGREEEGGAGREPGEWSSGNSGSRGSARGRGESGGNERGGYCRGADELPSLSSVMAAAANMPAQRPRQRQRTPLPSPVQAEVWAQQRALERVAEEVEAEIARALAERRTDDAVRLLWRERQAGRWAGSRCWSRAVAQLSLRGQWRKAKRLIDEVCRAQMGGHAGGEGQAERGKAWEQQWPAGSAVGSGAGGSGEVFREVQVDEDAFGLAVMAAARSGCAADAAAMPCSHLFPLNLPSPSPLLPLPIRPPISGAPGADAARGAPSARGGVERRGEPHGPRPRARCRRREALQRVLRRRCCQGALLAEPFLTRTTPCLLSSPELSSHASGNSSLHSSNPPYLPLYAHPMHSISPSYPPSYSPLCPPLYPPLYHHLNPPICLRFCPPFYPPFPPLLLPASTPKSSSHASGHSNPQPSVRPTSPLYPPPVRPLSLTVPSPFPPSFPSEPPPHMRLDTPAFNPLSPPMFPQSLPSPPYYPPPCAPFPPPSPPERPPHSSGHSLHPPIPPPIFPLFPLLSHPHAPPIPPLPPQSAPHMRPDTAAFNAAINAAVTAGDLPLAERLLGEGMAGAGVTPDAISFNILIKGRAAQGMPECAHELLRHMLAQGRAARCSVLQLVAGRTARLGIVQLGGGGLCGVRHDEAQGVQPDAASFNSVVAGYVACGMMGEAQALVQTMWDQGEGQGEGGREGQDQGEAEAEGEGQGEEKGAEGKEGGKHRVGVGPNVRMLSILIKGLVASGDLAAAFQVRSLPLLLPTDPLHTALSHWPDWFERMKQRRDTAPNHITYATLMHALVSSPPHLIPAPILARAAAAYASAAAASAVASTSAASAAVAATPFTGASAVTSAASQAALAASSTNPPALPPLAPATSPDAAAAADGVDSRGAVASLRKPSVWKAAGPSNAGAGSESLSGAGSLTGTGSGAGAGRGEAVEQQGLGNGRAGVLAGSSRRNRMVVRTGFSNPTRRENSEALAGAGNLDELAVVAARQLLEEMRARGVAGNTAVLNVLVKAHCDRGQMGEVEALLREMGCGGGAGSGKRRLMQGTASPAAPNTGEAAGEAAGGFQGASKAPQKPPVAGEIADASEGSATRGGGVWGVRPNAATFVTIIAACGRAGTWKGRGQAKWSARGDAVSGADTIAEPGVLPQAAGRYAAGALVNPSSSFVGESWSSRTSETGTSFYDPVDVRYESEWGGAEAALQWFARMRREGIAPTVQVYTALISALGQAPDADPARALSVFEELLVEAGSGGVRLGGREGGGSRGGRGSAAMSGGEELRVDAAAWGAVIDSQARAGLVEQAWSLYQRAKSPPFRVTFILRSPPRSHLALTSLSPRSHLALTSLSPRSHLALTSLSPRSHLALTSLSPRSHLALTSLSPRSHLALTSLSPRSHLALTSLSPMMNLILPPHSHLASASVVPVPATNDTQMCALATAEGGGTPSTCLNLSLSPPSSLSPLFSHLQAASVVPTPTTYGSLGRAQATAERAGEALVLWCDSKGSTATYGSLVRALAAAERAGEALVLWRDLKERLVGAQGSDWEEGLELGGIEGGEGRWELMGEAREGRWEELGETGGSGSEGGSEGEEEGGMGESEGEEGGVVEVVGVRGEREWVRSRWEQRGDGGGVRGRVVGVAAERVTWRAGVAGGGAKGAAGVCVDEAVMDGLMLIFMQAGYFQRALEVVGAMERAGLAPDRLKYKRMLITSLSSRRHRALSSLSTATAAPDEFPGSRGFEALKFWLGLPNRLYESDWSWRD